MVTKEDQIRLSKDPKSRPCPPGQCSDILQYPEVPEGEEDPHARVQAMRNADPPANQHEIDSALHNIQQGHITHGRQLSRNRSAQEREDGEKGDWQNIKAICVVCRRTREVDQAPNENTIVEAKDEAAMSPRTRDQAVENAAFSKRYPANRVQYKLPAVQVPGRAPQVRGGRARAIREIFRNANARTPSFIPI